MNDALAREARRSTRFPNTLPEKMRLSVRQAREAELEWIYQARHEVYASELGQHPENSARKLKDTLDGNNTYLVVAVGEDIFGFVSITPPSAGSYSIDKYFSRGDLPFKFDDRLYEIRLLTVLKEHRKSEIAFLLMYSAFAGSRRITERGWSRLADEKFFRYISRLASIPSISP